jgi:sec-independent protein translocase protein TatA
MMLLLIPLFIGTTELLLIAGIALLLFGGKKLPEMMHGLGKGVKEFKNGLKEENPTENKSDEIPDNNNVIAQPNDKESEPNK